MLGFDPEELCTDVAPALAPRATGVLLTGAPVTGATLGGLGVLGVPGRLGVLTVGVVTVGVVTVGVVTVGVGSTDTPTLGVVTLTGGSETVIGGRLTSSGLEPSEDPPSSGSGSFRVSAAAPEADEAIAASDSRAVSAQRTRISTAVLG